MTTVLIVDDDVDHRELMSLALSRDGHRVVLAADTAAATTALLGGDIDVAVVDVRMPGESGIEFCRRLRAEPGTELLPVMLISADVDDQRIVSALHAGADDFMTKPFHRGELCSRLHNLLLRKPDPVRASATAANAALRAARHAMPRAAAPAAASTRRTA